MFGGKALGWMAGALIWMPGAPGKRTLRGRQGTGQGVALIFIPAGGGGGSPLDPGDLAPV